MSPHVRSTVVVFSLSSNSLAIAELLTLFMYQNAKKKKHIKGGRVSHSQPAAREIFVRTSKLFVVLIGESK
jgi:hypothetical protein